VRAYERVWAMHLQGHAIAHIARTVGISRQTAYRYLAMSHPPERKRKYERASRPSTRISRTCDTAGARGAATPINYGGRFGQWAIRNPAAPWPIS
jgi:hypothetical protein